ncbi:MAG: hypothetical protein Ct9H300mP16_09540 [Pseudomonadota bacterium]|nr:MAG: hypothetical protein Ct9H300mP16_09540 [Pseudomonadota bacterium]
MVIAMGPWSILATQWLALPAVYGLKRGTASRWHHPGRAAGKPLSDYEDAEGERHGPELVPRADGRFTCAAFPATSLSSGTRRHLRATVLNVNACPTCRPDFQHAHRGYRNPSAGVLPANLRGAMPLIGPVPGAPRGVHRHRPQLLGMLNARTGLAMAELIAEGQSRTLDLGRLTPGRLPTHHFGS